MIKKFNKGTLLFSLTCLLFIFTALDTPKFYYRYKAFLACQFSDSIGVTKQEFDGLLTQPLCAKDSAGNVHKIESFEITYAERGLYQDSTGLPIIFTDYSIEECKGDSIPVKWKSNFYENGHKGDTVSIDRILVRGSDQKPYYCKRLKFVIR